MRRRIFIALLCPWLLAAAATDAEETDAATGVEELAAASAPAAQQPSPAEISARALEIEAREAALRVLQDDVESRLAELERLQTAALAVLEPERARREEELAKLVDFYQNMKPKQAARLLEKLPLELATEVVARMKKREAGKILNVMESGRAVKISRRMAGKKS